jgi:hypothetical protein
MRSPTPSSPSARLQGKGKCESDSAQAHQDEPRQRPTSYAAAESALPVSRRMPIMWQTAKARSARFIV